MSVYLSSSAALPHLDVSRERRSSRARVAAALLGVLACGVAVASVATFLELDARARCETERDSSGIGRTVALRALDAPERYGQFLYRVTSDRSGYRAAVVVKEGPFAGEAWERDAEGRIRHHSDVCRDVSSSLLAALEDK